MEAESVRSGRKGAEEQGPPLAAVTITELHGDSYLGTAGGRQAKQEPAFFLVLA